MKTLVNKFNPQVKITAPEIVFNAFGDYHIKGVRCTLYIDDWTLVEEEPEKIYYKMLDNKANCPFDKGDCRYCTVQFCGAREENQIETHSTAEPVDLEKFIEKAQRVLYSSNPDDYIKLVKELAELGRKGGSK